MRHPQWIYPRYEHISLHLVDLLERVEVLGLFDVRRGGTSGVASKRGVPSDIPAV